MVHSEESKDKILQILETTPFISHAAKKVGVSRATVYRWMEEDARFKRSVQRALSSGRESLGEIAESVLVKKIREENLGAVKFFLQHNSARYSARHTIPTSENSTPELLPEREKTLEELLMNADGKIEIGKNAYAALEAQGEDMSAYALRKPPSNPIL